MPNSVEQHLHVVGSKAHVDRFIEIGFLRRNKEQFDNLLDLRRLCPLKREPKATYTHESAVILMHYRTRTQAFFSMITSWDYPGEFYARLAVHWPTLAFACSVNEEMGSFGGIVIGVNGEVTNLVEDYGAAGYSRRRQAGRIRRALKVWGEVLDRDRDWRLLANEPWKHRSMPFDAHFDDDFWFYFKSRVEMAAFRARLWRQYAAAASGWGVEGNAFAQDGEPALIPIIRADRALVYLRQRKCDSGDPHRSQRP